MNITYEDIKPIIEREQLTEYRMVVWFKADNSPKIIESSANIQRSQAEYNQVESIVRDDIIDHLQDVVRGVVGGVLGKGLVGRISTRATERLMHENRRKFSYSKMDKRRAVVEAFKRVATQFSFDRNTGSWKLIEGLSQFDKKRVDNPITNGYDKEVLARMLIELAEIDAGISNKEQTFLESYLDHNVGSVRELALMDPLSKVELEEVSQKSKETVFMLATAMVLVDERASASEKTHLLTFAGMFGFSTEKVNELILNAKLFILEQAIYKVGHSREALFAFADKIKLSREEAERHFIRYKKRIDFA
ncbi:MAG: hypothetical protein AAF502_15985 [Bacteroidota bacterium]